MVTHDPLREAYSNGKRSVRFERRKAGKVSSTGFWDLGIGGADALVRSRSPDRLSTKAKLEPDSSRELQRTHVGARRQAGDLARAAALNVVIRQT